jgi:hypothetical protein
MGMGEPFLNYDNVWGAVKIFNDAKYFTKQKNLLTALAAYSYAHAWLDAGVRARVFEANHSGSEFGLHAPDSVRLQ